MAEKNRTGIPWRTAGQYRDCRHFSTTDTTGRTFHCARTNTTRTSCEACWTCPKCDNPLLTDSLTQTRGRGRLVAEHAKKCVICGAYIEEVLQVTTTRMAEHKGEDACQVHGCRNTAYEGYRHTEEIDGEERTFLICETHRRRIKTWRLHPEKGEDQKPIIVEDGQLIDNPKYKKLDKRKESA